MSRAAFLFHDELTQFLAPQRRMRVFAHDCARAASLKNAIESLGVPHTEVGRLTVNGQPASLSHTVREGDVVEVFAQRAGDIPPETSPRFIADAHLGALARYLRMLGLDTLFDNGYRDRAVVEIAAREGRIVLSRDRELLKCRDVLRGCFVHAMRPQEQLREVVGRYALASRLRPFTLCLHCNLILVPVARAEIEDAVPARILEHYARFVRCPGCRRVYWPGSHWARMSAMLADVAGAPSEQAPSIEPDPSSASRSSPDASCSPRPR